MSYMTALPKIDGQSGEVSIVCLFDRTILSPTMAIAFAAALLEAAATAEGDEMINRAQADRRSP